MAKYQKYVILCGAMMMNGVLYVTLVFGNLSAYIYSLHYIRHSPGSFDIDPSWMFPTYLLCSTFAILTMDTIRMKIGLRKTNGLGIALFFLANVSSYFTVSHSIWAFNATFMAMSGLSDGLIVPCGMIYLSSWFESQMGLATGLYQAAQAFVGVIINLLVTSYINSHNLSPDVTLGELHLFSQADVIDLVPKVFLILGGLCLIVQFTGFLLLRMPKSQSTTDEKLCLWKDTRGADAGKSRNGNGNLPDNENVLLKKTSDSISSSVVPLDRQFNNNGKDHTLLTTQEYQETSHLVCLSEMENREFTPIQVLKCERFYIIESAMISLAVGMVTVSNYSKLFGQIWIQDDQFLTLVSSNACLFNIVFVVGCGYLIDLVGLKNTMVAHLSVCAIFLSLWYFTARLSRWLYMFWTVILYSVHFNQYSLSMLSALKFFGKQHFATNLGLIELSTSVAYLVCPPVMAVTLKTLGWFWLFLLSGSLSFLALILITVRLPND